MMETNTVQDEIKFYGAKLLMTKLKIVGDPLELFRQLEIYKWNLKDSMYPLKIVRNVLWMQMLPMLQRGLGKAVVSKTGYRWFCYTKFWGDVFPGGKRYYRIRNSFAKDAWEIHSF